MRTALTIGIDGKGKAKLLAGPDVAAGTQREKFFALHTGEPSKEFERIELWQSDGRRKVYRSDAHRAALATAKAVEAAVGTA